MKGWGKEEDDGVYKKTWHNESNPEVYHLAAVLSKQPLGLLVRVYQLRLAVAGSWMAESLWTLAQVIHLLTDWVSLGQRSGSRVTVSHCGSVKLL